MDIGRNIKDLRKKNNITQDALAEYLHISPQAVSKWENGTALPDITLVPTIASFFHTSIDSLFGTDTGGALGREKEYTDKYRELCASGDVLGRCTLMRKALEEFPRNFRFMSNMARSLFYCMDSDEDFHELVSLCERVISDCKNGMLVCDATETLARAYSKIGDSQNAIKYAEQLPPIAFSKEFALEWALDGEERNEILQRNAFEFMLCMTARFMGRTGPQNGGFLAEMGKELTPSQRISVLQSVLDIIRIIFPDENYLLVNGRVAEIHSHMARVYAQEGDRKKAIDHLYLWEKYADRFDGEKDKNLRYTSIFFDRLSFDGTRITRHHDKNENSRILRKLNKWECFDSMRNDVEFKKFYKRIEEKVKR